MGGIMGEAAKSFTPQNTYSVDTSQFLNAANQAQANQASNYANQGQLAQMLMAQAQGQGPNPAQQMLNQQTNQNNQQNAGLIASQKGINPAQAARFAAQNAASSNQSAAGQGALMGAQQQLAAQSSLGSVYGQMGNQNLQNQQINTQAVTAGNQANAAASAQNAAANQGTASGFLGSTGSAGMKLAGFAHGGMIPMYADGGQAPAPASTGMSFDTGASNKIAQMLMAQAGVPVYASGVNFGNHPAAAAPAPKPTAPPQQIWLAPSQFGARPAAPQQMPMFAQGAIVPGTANKAGNSYANDTVPAMLSPGEVVLPRSVTESDDAPELAKEFVQHIKRMNAKKGVA